MVNAVHDFNAQTGAGAFNGAMLPALVKVEWQGTLPKLICVPRVPTPQSSQDVQQGYELQQPAAPCPAEDFGVQIARSAPSGPSLAGKAAREVSLARHHMSSICGGDSLLHAWGDSSSCVVLIWETYGKRCMTDHAAVKADLQHARFLDSSV